MKLQKSNKKDKGVGVALSLKKKKVSLKKKKKTASLKKKQKTKTMRVEKSKSESGSESKSKNDSSSIKPVVFDHFKFPKNIYPVKYIILFPHPKNKFKVSSIKFGFYPSKLKLAKLDRHFVEHKKFIQKKDSIQRLIDILGNEEFLKLNRHLNFHDFTSNTNIGSIPKKLYNIDLNFGWTNAWRKIYEIIHEFNLIDIHSKQLVHFDMCGFPGAFIFSTNHYIKTKTKIKNYDWHITSFNENTDVKKNKYKYLKDKFNLQRKYKDRFLYGSPKTSFNGDITNIDNIKALIKFYQHKKANFVTSDCGLNINWDESYLREQQMIKIHYSQFVCGLGVIAKGGNLVMKNYSQMKPLSVSIIYLMMLVFKKVYLVKPESSRQYGNEIYLVGKYYMNNLTTTQIHDLVELVNTLDNSKNINDCLFENMDSSIVKKIENKLSDYYKHLDKVKDIKDKLYEAEIFTLEKDPDLLVKKIKHIKKDSAYQIKGYFKNYFKKLKYQKIKKGDALL